MTNFKLIIMLCCIPFLFNACKQKPNTEKVTANYPEWVKNSVIYEVNIRQYTPEGTFKAFENHLPRLKELGVDILWLMPIHPIGEKNRKIPEGMKESLGSYYSVKDYKGINPEYGTEADFKELITKAHEMGFKVIIDWVANHTAWDNNWINQHPEWYKKDSSGKFVSPFDWTDVVSLDYNNNEMRLAMIDAMKYWVENFHIDGFRCDVAGMVPVDFWEQARPEIEKTKPVFMLAEDEKTISLFNKAFDAGYGWELHHLLHNIAQLKDSATSIYTYQQLTDSLYPPQSMKMNFVTNHDENSWNGTITEKFGAASHVFAMLTYTLPGLPLIYSGQEADYNKRLAFFVKDSIDWSNQQWYPFYKTLNELKHNNQCLYNPPYGGCFIPIKNSAKKHILSFLRKTNDNQILTIANLQDKEIAFVLDAKEYKGTYIDVFNNTTIEITKNMTMNLPAWGYMVLKKGE